MKSKSIYEELGGTYTKVGDYYFPNLTAIETTEEYPIGKYGRMRLQFLKNHRPGLYTDLLTTGKLEKHLYEIEQEARGQVELIVSAMAKSEGCDEALKARDPMRWVGLMNNYRMCAKEMLLEDIYTI